MASYWVGGCGPQGADMPARLWQLSLGQPRALCPRGQGPSPVGVGPRQPGAHKPEFLEAQETSDGISVSSASGQSGSHRWGQDLPFCKVTVSPLGQRHGPVTTCSLSWAHPDQSQPPPWGLTHRGPAQRLAASPLAGRPRCRAQPRPQADALAGYTQVGPSPLVSEF